MFSFFNLLALGILSSVTNAKALGIFFVIYLITNSLIMFCLDELMAKYDNNKSVGKTHGIYLTVVNTAWLCSPFIVSYLIADGDYRGVYWIALICSFILIILFKRSFDKYKDPEYHELKWLDTFKLLHSHKNLRKIYRINLLLQFFFAVMVIYSPIYLRQYIGFEWKEIGIIFTCMLVPFVIFEIPLGKLADRIGEKFILGLGFLIMSISTIIISFIHEPNLILWIVILFSTRVGASAIQIMSDTYFFKHSVSAKDPGVIGIYRNTSPLAYIIAPMFVTVFLIFLPYQYLFLTLGILMLSGIIYSATINDPKHEII